MQGLTSFIQDVHRPPGIWDISSNSFAWLSKVTGAQTELDMVFNALLSRPDLPLHI